MLNLEENFVATICSTKSVLNYVFSVVKYSAHWVLRPPSVRGVEVAKPSVVAKARVWI